MKIKVNDNTPIFITWPIFRVRNQEFILTMSLISLEVIFCHLWTIIIIVFHTAKRTRNYELTNVTTKLRRICICICSGLNWNWYFILNANWCDKAYRQDFAGAIFNSDQTSYIDRPFENIKRVYQLFWDTIFDCYGLLNIWKTHICHEIINFGVEM